MRRGRWSLRGCRVGGGVRTYAEPFFSAEERKAFIAEIEMELKPPGGGDVKEGRRASREETLGRLLGAVKTALAPLIS